MNKLFNTIKKYNINEEDFSFYGKDKVKINYDINYLPNKNSKLILVTSINPTEAGEGKTTLSIGLADGLNKLGYNTILSLREPSLGPVFGLKGGATGGGKSMVIPSDDINLHFTGDFHAITSAHNLLSALIDNHIYFENSLNFKEVLWPRTLDVNDRQLRNIETPLRKDSFVITAASEIMAILALAKSIDDLHNRINNILIGINYNNEFIYVKDLGCANALVTLLKDAFNPNLVLTKENTLSFIHCGPFANIAHGCSSVVSTNLALKMADYVVTEAGFGADLGMEKFLNIKLPLLDKNLDLVCLVATTHSLKAHGNLENYYEPNLEALKLGIANLEKHIENIINLNLNFVIAINKHLNDQKDELDFLYNWAKERNYPISIVDSFNEGVNDTVNLAQLVVDKINSNNIKNINPIYNLDDRPEIKIKKIAQKIYGANNIEFSKRALRNLDKYYSIIKDLPVCIAKTPSSLSDDSKLLGRPSNFTIRITDIKPMTGANFFVAQTKGIILMPGLNKNPRAFNF